MLNNALRDRSRMGGHSARSDGRLSPARLDYQREPSARNFLRARPTLATAALGELCARTLYADGVAAAEAVRRREVTRALDRVFEANTLLSGIGFESAGLAAAHAVAQGLTVLPRLTICLAEWLPQA
jgi:glycerol dehydrogenase-like iron-containing ADH family enzyme